jgi:hypothetical protein
VALLKVGKDLLDGKVSLFVEGGWTIPNGWSARAGASVSPAKDFPVISIDSVVMGEKRDVAFSDTIMSAAWKF